MEDLKIGDKAPLFAAQTQLDREVSLSDYLGKKVILYFYPKDSTPGCTAQACSLRDAETILEDKGYQVIGVSGDSIASHKRFATKQSLQFPLLADENHLIAESYGVWRLKKFMGREKMGIVRTTFIIDENGVISNIIKKVDTKAHSEQILKQE